MTRCPIKAVFIIIAIVILVSVGNTFSQSERSGFAPTVKPFLWLQAGFVNDETPTYQPTFEFAHARFGLKGKVHEKIGYHLMIEGVHGGGYDPRVYQAWVDYNFHKYINFRIGQFKYPFGIEAYPGFVWWKFISPSYVSAGVIKYMGRRNSGEDGLFRDVGLQLSGTCRPNEDYTLVYKIMAMNGTGVNQSDNNDAKDFVVHGILETSFGADIGLSYYSGRFGENVDSLIIVVDTVTGTQYYNLLRYTLKGRDEWALGLDLTWRHQIGTRDLRIQGEYIAASYDADPRDVKPWGYYLYGTMFVIPSVEVGIRYDYYEPDRNARDPDTDAEIDVEKKRVTLAGYYHFAENQLVTINYEFIDDDVDGRENLLTILCQITL